MVIKPITAQVAAPTSTGAASDVSSSVIVRCVNSGSTARLITLEEAGGTDKGTFTLEANGSIYIKKDKTDKIFAANAEILLTGVYILQG